MRFKYAGTLNSPKAPIDMTPMIDIVFNLLLFFVLSSSYVQHTSMEVKLPQASTSAAIEGDIVVIELTRDERIFLQGKEVFLSEIEAKLREYYPEPNLPKPLLIRADEYARHGSVIALLDISRRVGITSLNVATIQKEKKEK